MGHECEGAGMRNCAKLYPAGCTLLDLAQVSPLHTSPIRITEMGTSDWGPSSGQKEA